MGNGDVEMKGRRLGDPLPPDQQLMNRDGLKQIVNDWDSYQPIAKENVHLVLMYKILELLIAKGEQK